MGWKSKLGDGKWISMQESSNSLRKEGSWPPWYSNNEATGVQDSCAAIYSNKWFSAPCNQPPTQYNSVCAIPTRPNLILRGNLKYSIQ